MTYICVKCRSFFTKGEITVYPNISGAICEGCYTEYVRWKQRQKGFDDCFKKSTEYCSHSECRYIEICCRELVA